MKKQVIIIHGGEAFDNYGAYLVFLRKYKLDLKRFKSGKKDWKSSLNKRLGKNFEVILLTMPNKLNAKYLEWKIIFKKFIPYFKPGVILIGHSLGGIFLARYLSENKIPKKVRATFLIAAPYNVKKSGLADFILPKSLKKFEKQSGKIFLYQSQDDSIVPFKDFENYRKNLKNSVGRVFKNRGHFNQASLSELVRDLKSI